MSSLSLILRYGAFAVVATLANLGAQRLVFAIAPEAMCLVAALVCGTGAGLVVKYLLDKKWIFHDAVRPAAQEARTFSLYTLTGVGTTAVFWGMESLFWTLWQTQGMRELGAVIGLAIGYVVKYQLDKRFVFAKPDFAKLPE